MAVAVYSCAVARTSVKGASTLEKAPLTRVAEKLSSR